MGDIKFISGKDAECNDIYQKPKDLICGAFNDTPATEFGVPTVSAFIDPFTCTTKLLPDVTKISTYSVASVNTANKNSVQILPNGDVYFVDSFGVATLIDHKCCLDVIPTVLPALDTSLHETVQLLANGTKWIVDDTGDAMQINGVVADNVTITGNGTSASPLVAKIPAVTSGAGVPPNIAGNPVVWTDTATGDVYYRDVTGTVVRIEHPLSCEEVQDCLATAFPFLTYDDAGNRFIFTAGVNGQVWTTVGGVSQWAALPAEVPLTVVDTASVDLTASGTIGHTLQANVKVSGVAGNQASINADGIYVPTPAIQPETPLTVVDTSSVDLTASGTDNHTLQATVKVSATAGNKTVVNADGIYTPETPLTVVDTASVDLTASGTDSHTLQAAVKISGVAGNQVVVNADGIYVPMAAVVNVCSSLQAFPNGGTLAAGDMVVVPGSGANACQLKSFPAIAGDNWGSQTVQHDGTLSGNGTAASPLAVIPCAVVQGVANSATTVQTGDRVIVKTAAGCEARPMPAAAGVANDCTLVNSAGTLGVNSSILMAGSTLTIGSARASVLNSNPITANSVMSNVVSANISNASACRGGTVKVDVSFGFWGQQIPTDIGFVQAANFQVNVNGGGWFTASSMLGSEGKDRYVGAGDASDMGQDGTTVSFIVNVPAGGSTNIQARIVTLVDANVSYCEDPIISWFGLAL